MKDKIEKFLDININIIYDLDPKKTISLIINTFEINYDVAADIFLRWKAKKLKIKKFKVNRNLDRRVKKISLKKNLKGELIGQNGTYEKFENGLLLKRNGGFVFFENKLEAIQFFNEIIIAFETLENSNKEKVEEEIC